MDKGPKYGVLPKIGQNVSRPSFGTDRVAHTPPSEYDFRIMRRTLFAALCITTALVSLGAFSGPANAADLPKGMSIVPGHSLYYVTRDAYVRELPNNDAARIGQIMKGQRLTVAGKVVIPKSKGPNWLALKRPDGTVGYVFSAPLVAMIDGTLAAPLQGKLSEQGRPDCRYVVAFEGRTQIAGETQQTADYDIAFECAGKDADTPLTFNAGMFITELPFDDKRDVYQINIDLWDMRVNGEDFLSITALYDPDAKRVNFDRVNDDKLRTPAMIPPETAADVPAALAGALHMTYAILPTSAWDQLASTPKPEPETPSAN